MYIFKKKLAMMAVSIGILAGCAQYSGAAINSSHSNTVLDQKMSHQTIQLNVGQTFTVRLPSNPSTGYSWFVTDNSKSILQYSEPTFETRQQSELIAGAPGISVWQFKAIKAGEQDLRLEYRPGWESKEIAADSQVVYHVVVK